MIDPCTGGKNCNVLSAKPDAFFGAAIREYYEQTGAGADVNAIPTYRTMNRMLTG